ncbi:hypothetical protein C8J95_11269 [Elizabethkingia sp. YR214]|uniref:hypothetical protein n=1 Tax=Elizabethkingia sp. YR214 TaxID=2135667 RepID=UPI000D2FCB56|nr:hypothetical protein [Elizabethkingia sp. YR214]PUB25902.1 hypothetical protein C8J95_11269 [Elizabethkingia sp. YR214]
MKVPVSKQLINYLLLICISVAGTGIFGMVATGQKWDLNIILILLSGIPAILFACFLLSKKVEFRDHKKIRKQDRIFRLPFSSTVAFAAFVVCILFLIAGLATVVENKDTIGLLMLLVSLSIIIFTAVCVEHPGIWFSDTFNAEDAIEQFRDASPKSSLDEDGIFSYDNSSFTIRFVEEIKTIRWDDIVLISTYKKDLLTVDCIMIEIHLKETLISINDQAEGYMKFMETASQRLQHFKKDWFMAVAFPAFETNETVIYKRLNDEKT